MFDLAGKFPHLGNPNAERGERVRLMNEWVFLCVESDQKRRIFRPQFVFCFVFYTEF